MADKHLCVAIYVTQDQADEAFSRLRMESSDMDLFSFVGRDTWKGMVGSRNTGERFLYRGNQGPFWGKLWSALHGWGVFWLFEDGPVLVAGRWSGLSLRHRRRAMAIGTQAVLRRRFPVSASPRKASCNMRRRS